MASSSALVAFTVLTACADARDDAPPEGATVATRDSVIIDGATPSCSGCVLYVAPPVVIGSPSDPDIPQRVPQVIRDRRGNHLLVFDGWSNKPILRYDAAGRFQGRLGRTGSGPGEYTMTMRVVLGNADSVLVFAGSRGQLFDPDGRYARVIRLPPRVGLIGPAPDSTGIMFGALTPTDFDTYGAPPLVFRLAGDGAPLDSFPVFSAVTGTTTIRSGSRQREIPRRISAAPVVGPDGSIWTLEPSLYRLERHSPDGASRQLFGIALPGQPRPMLTAAQIESATVKTAPPVTRTVPRGAEQPIRPTATRTSMSIDSAGLLWVVRTIPAPRWDTITVKAMYASPNEAPYERSMPRDVEDRFYHTVVEVIDPKQPALLARTELPFFGHAAAPGYVARVTTDQEGYFLTSVYKLELRR